MALNKAWGAAAVIAFMAGVGSAHAEYPDQMLQSAVERCEESPDAPPNGFAPFEEMQQTAATGPDTYSRHRQLRPEYPNGTFATDVYGARGLQYFATLSGGAPAGKQYAWSVMSVPRVVPPEQRNGAYALWDAVILEVERPFAPLLESAAGAAARESFEDVKERSSARIMPDNRLMATFIVARGDDPQRQVIKQWTSLIGSWMMNVILKSYPKKEVSTGRQVAYDHIAYFHALTPARFSPSTKYTFVSSTRLGTAGPPAFAFLIGGSGKCLSAKSIKTVAGR